MNKSIKIFASIFLVLVLGVSILTPAFAVECNNSEYVIGSKQDEDDHAEAGLVIITEDPNGGTPRSARSNWMLFQMNVGAVYNMLTTTGEESFLKSDLTHGGLLIQGWLTRSSGELQQAVAGACTYDSVSGTYTSSHRVVTTTGSIYALFSQDSFSKWEIYYGFVQNGVQSSNTYITGTIFFYDTNEA